jgi:hypothetical protein
MDTMKVVGWLAMVAIVTFIVVIGAIGWAHATLVRQPGSPSCIADCGRR